MHIFGNSHIPGEFNRRMVTSQRLPHYNLTVNHPTGRVLGVHPALPLGAHLIHLGLGGDPQLKNLLPHLATENPISERSACN